MMKTPAAIWLYVVSCHKIPHRWTRNPRKMTRAPNEILSMGPRVRRDATGSRSYVLCVVSVEVPWVRRGTQ